MSKLSRIAALVLCPVLGCGAQSAPSDLGPDGNLEAVRGPEAPLSDGGTPTWWRPTPATPIHWHWQLSQDFSFPRDVLPNKTVYDLDGELTSAETVAKLHALGPDVVVICYFDAGVYEDYRSDKARFPASVIGNPDEGWDGSYWLDIRQLDILLPIMRDRMINWCKNKGFDAIEPDETEVWSNDSGFPITKAQNNAFNKAIADLAHSLGMSVGLKGNNTEAPELVNYFDWALTEQCWEYDECALFKNSFIAQGKAVFNVEYNVNPNCTRANQWHINSSRRDLELVGPTASGYLYQPCIPDTQATW
ncbi:endo alpha-1,4 polygalactosaminidase [Cystobacter fuscus]|uniref:endo alpha-1,4 polygalactosaminidase n=1 Tax=Cystobacter fuscus TaxID=43 RepID=UPI0037C0C309